MVPVVVVITARAGDLQRRLSMPIQTPPQLPAAVHIQPRNPSARLRPYRRPVILPHDHSAPHRLKPYFRRLLIARRAPPSRISIAPRRNRDIAAAPVKSCSPFHLSCHPHRSAVAPVIPVAGRVPHRYTRPVPQMPHPFIVAVPHPARIPLRPHSRIPVIAWRHWGRVWEVEYNYLVSRFDSKKIMETPGIPLTRWFDAVLLRKDQVDQRDNVRAVFVQGHASNSITRIPESMKALPELELLVVADPHPTTWASLAVEAGRKDNMYLLPVCTQFETSGSRVASNRSLQWGEPIVKPIFEV